MRRTYASLDTKGPLGDSHRGELTTKYSTVHIGLGCLPPAAVSIYIKIYTILYSLPVLLGASSRSPHLGFCSKYSSMETGSALRSLSGVFSSHIRLRVVALSGVWWQRIVGESHGGSPPHEQGGSESPVMFAMTAWRT